MPVDSYLFEKVRPFYDKDYLDFTLKMPTSRRFGQSLYQAMIYKIGPEIRDLPNANNHVYLHRTVLANRAAKAKYLVQESLSRAANRVVRPTKKRVEHPRFARLAIRLRSDDKFRSTVTNFLNSAECNDAIFNKSGIQLLLDQHYGGAKDHSVLLGYIGTFAFGLPYFVNRTTQCPPEAQPLIVE
jgi:hypothetical protein